MAPSIPAPGALAGALERWAAAACRFELDECAIAVVALALTREMAPEVVAWPAQQSRGSRRAAIALLGPRFGDGQVVAAIAGLDQTNLIMRSSARWTDDELMVSPQLLAWCLAAPEKTKAASRSARPPSTDYFVVRGVDGSGRDHYVAELVAREQLAAVTRTPASLREVPHDLEPTLSGGVAVLDLRGADVSPGEIARGVRFLERSKAPCVALLDSGQDAPRVHGRVARMVDLRNTRSADRIEAWRAALRGAGAASSEAAEGAAIELGGTTGAGPGLARRVAAMLPREAGDARTVARAARAVLVALAQPSALRGVVVEEPEPADATLVLANHARSHLDRFVVLCRVGHGGGPRRGAKALFSGPPGTGKSHAARIIAARLERALFRVDLPAVLSKWIGETEQNLRRVFETAGNAGAVLLFDEGDALMGRRGSVERGADRYANVEVAHLLQEMEHHDGVVIVTTNRQRDVDGAFLRRFDAVIEFPKPDRADRLALWRLALGEGVGALDPLFLQRIANEVDVSGGHIVAAAALARALATDRGDKVPSERDVADAIATELAKLGSSFGVRKWEAQGRADG